MYKFSERLAWVAGIALPVGETLRRWGTWWDFPPAYLDDVLIGAFFLAAAWMSRRGGSLGPRYLAAAYGFALGIGFMSLGFSLVQIDRPDPAGVSGATAAVAKVVMVILGLAGLVGAFGEPARRPDAPAAVL